MLAVYDPVENYTGNAVATEFDFNFTITELSQLEVIIGDTDGLEVSRVRGTDVTLIDEVTFDETNGGGTVTFLTAPADGYMIRLLLANDSPKQPSEFKNKFDFTLARVERAFDYVASAIQRVSYLAQRSVRLHELDDSSAFDLTLPPGVAANTDDLIPHFTEGGIAPVSLWTPVADLQAAVAAAAAAADAQQAAEDAQQAAEDAASNAQVAETNAIAAAATATAAALGSTPDIIGDGASTDPVSGSLDWGQGTSTRWFTTWFIRGATDHETLTGVNAGLNPGQQIILIVPPSAPNAVDLSDAATGVTLNGDWIGDPGRSLCMMWDGSTWLELWRR